MASSIHASMLTTAHRQTRGRVGRVGTGRRWRRRPRSTGLGQGPTPDARRPGTGATRRTAPVPAAVALLKLGETVLRPEKVKVGAHEVVNCAQAPHGLVARRRRGDPHQRAATSDGGVLPSSPLPRPAHDPCGTTRTVGSNLSHLLLDGRHVGDEHKRVLLLQRKRHILQGERGGGAGCCARGLMWVRPRATRCLVRSRPLRTTPQAMA